MSRVVDEVRFVMLETGIMAAMSSSTKPSPCVSHGPLRSSVWTQRSGASTSRPCLVCDCARLCVLVTHRGVWLSVRDAPVHRPPNSCRLSVQHGGVHGAAGAP
jgi:hypothetical protein